MVSLRFTSLTKVFLFVTDQMLRASDDTRVLNSANSLSHLHTGEHRVRAEAFPVTACSGSTSQWSSDGTELYVDPFTAVLGTHGLTTGEGKATAPGSSDVDTSRESRVVISCRLSISTAQVKIPVTKPTESNSEWRVLHAEPSEAQARNTSSITNTSVQDPANEGSVARLNVASPNPTNVPDSGRHVDLFQQGQLADERARFRVGAAPVSRSGTPWRRIEWWRGLKILCPSSSYGVGGVGTRVCAVRELLMVSNQFETRQTVQRRQGQQCVSFTVGRGRY